MNELFRSLLNLPAQASTFAEEIDLLHFIIISTSMLGWALVVLAVARFLIRWRHGASHGRPRASYRGVPLWAEVGAIVGLLAGFLTFWVVGHAQYVRLETPPGDAVDVYVVGKQWMWSFAHPDGAASDADLYVPVGRPIRLLITSQDVIHSFFVPAFRIKQDAVPGRMTTAWFEAKTPGEYPILCAEYCGLSHSRMRGRVRALTPEQYERWQRGDLDMPELSKGTPLLGLEQTGARTAQTHSMAEAGLRVATVRGCLRCHTVDGTPHLGPSWARLYGAQVPLEDGTTVTADDAYLTRSMMEPMAEVHRTYARIMPSYLGVLSAAEVGALVALIHSLADVSADQARAPFPEPTTAPVVLPHERPLPASPVDDAPMEKAP